MRRKSKALDAAMLASVSAIGLTLVCVPARAQTVEPTNADAKSQATSEAEAAPRPDDIVVTARRRSESLIAVPVTVTAVSGAQLATRGINSLDGISRTIPQLIVTEATGSPQGGAITLRGIGAGDALAFGDQAVAFSIDGVLIARSTPRRFTTLDIAEVQVLKGPQALYFGKNSPGGVIMIRTADPTDHFEAGLSAEHEFVADETRLTGYISGPLTDSFGVRVAAAYSKMVGYLDNIATPGSSLYEPTSRRSPHSEDFSIRGTLKFDNGGPLTAKAKFSFGTLRTDGQTGGQQLVACPLGMPQLGGPDDCRANRTIVRASLGPVFGRGGANTVTGAAIQGIPLLGTGASYFKQQQYLAGLELGYKISDVLAVASNTGFYSATNSGADNFTLADTTRPSSILANGIALQTSEFSQELRLTSSFSGIFNFMVGGYFQTQHGRYDTAAALNAINPTPLFPPIAFKQQGETYSGFGSVSVKPIETIEISGGVRYSNETKKLSAFRQASGVIAGVPYVPGTEVPIVNSDRGFDNWSPEGTISWRPTNKLTIFAGYRSGFISGGFNSTGLGTAVAVLPDRSYDQELVEGFEGGIKTSALDGKLRVNLAAFTYKIKNLQVTSTVNLNGVTTQVANNAAAARSKGVELDGSLDTPLKGLTINGALSYNSARYTKYDQSPCYVGQTIADGCDLNLISGAYRNQDLSGKPLVRAPEWGAAVGGTYKIEAGNGIGLTLSANGNYSSSFYADALDSPGSLQTGYWLFDAAATVSLPHGIEISLIGRNLGNKYYFTRSVDVPLTGAGTGTSVGRLADTGAIIGRPREINLRASIKF